jgi:hypothetical protein
VHTHTQTHNIQHLLASTHLFALRMPLVEGNYLGSQVQHSFGLCC